MKKYRIRKLSPLWWFTRVGGALISVAGYYSIILILSGITTY